MATGFAALAGVGRDRSAVAPGGERLLVLPLGDHEVAVLALDRTEQLEPEEAGRAVDRVGAVAKRFSSSSWLSGRDRDGVDLHDGHGVEPSERSTSLMPVPTLSDVVDLLHGWYPPATADSLGRRRPRARRPGRSRSPRCCSRSTRRSRSRREAAEWGADLLVVHHPLFLKPVHGFAADHARRAAPSATLAGAGCALLTAHTNADQARRRGVRGDGDRARADRPRAARCRRRGRAAGQARRLRPGRATPTRLRAVARRRPAPAGSATTTTRRSRRPGRAGSGRSRAPTRRSARSGDVEVVDEVRIEVVLPRRAARPRSSRAMLAAHPYEEPAYDVVELADPGTRARPAPAGSATSRATTLARVRRDASPRRCPTTAHGVRVGGDPDRPYAGSRVCGGAGDFLLDTVARHRRRRLRHQRPAAPPGERSSSSRAGRRCVDVAHWAAEWTWLPVVEARLRAALGDTVETRVSTICTDPWQFRI